MPQQTTATSKKSSTKSTAASSAAKSSVAKPSAAKAESKPSAAKSRMVAAESAGTSAKGPSRASKASSSSGQQIAISDDVRRNMIATAAYFRAEQRGFNGGGETEDWLQAEAEIDAMLYH